MDPFRSFFDPPKKGSFRGFFEEDPEEEARQDQNQGEAVATINRELGGAEEKRIGPRKRLFGNATPDITVTAKAPPKNLVTAIRRAQQVDIQASQSPEARRNRDRALAENLKSLDNTKRFFNDIAFAPGQPVLGALRNVVSKGTALPDRLGGDLARRATSELDDLSAEAVEASGHIPGSQLSQIVGNVAGNIGSEVALFRGSGKLLTGGATALARSGSGAANIGRRIAALSKLADRAKGGAGIAARTARDAAAFLPLNLVNSADRDLSAAGGFSDLSQRFFGGNVEEGKTKFLEDVSQDPLKRTAFELALDVGAGGIVEAGLSGLKRIGSLRNSRKASESIAESLRDRGPEIGAARRRTDQFFDTPQEPTVNFDDGSSFRFDPGPAPAPGSVAPETVPEVLPGKKLSRKQKKAAAKVEPGPVRVMDSADGLDLSDVNTLRRLNQVSDAVDTKGKRLLDQARGKADSFRQAKTSLAHLESTMDPDATLAEYLKTSAGRGFVRTLVDDGVFTPAELPNLVDLATDTLTGEGRDAVRSMMMVAALRDVDAIDRAPANALAKLEQAFVPLVRSSGGQHDLGQTVAQALDVMSRARSRGVPLSGVIDQTGFDFAAGPVPPRVAAMARFLDASPKRRVTEAFQTWARLADEARGNAESIDLLGGQGIESPAQAFARLFAEGDPRIAELPIQTFPRQPDLFTPRLDEARGGGGPELPGKITEDELRARSPELVGEQRTVAGADDPRQQLLLSPRPGQINPPVLFALEAGGPPVAALDIQAAEAVADRLRGISNDLDRGKRNTTSRGPASDTPVVDAEGRAIPRPLTRRAVTEIATGAIGTGFGISEGESFGERLQLGVFAGAAASLGTRFAGLSVKALRDAKAATKSPQVKSMQRIVQLMSEGFDIPIRSGVRWWAELNAGERADALGYFDPNRGQRLVRLRHTAQVSTGIHEIGHVLDNDFRAALRGGPAPQPIWRAALDQETLTELYGLGRSLYPEGRSEQLYISEGFAEWVRRYTLGNNVAELTPKASNLLNQMLDSNPKWRQTIETIKEEVGRHIAGTPEERALAMMSGDSRGTLRSAKFARDWLDRHVDVVEAARSLGVQPEMVRGKRFRDNSAARVRMAARAHGMAAWALNNGVADERTGQYITRPFMQMVEALTNDETLEFQTYLVAERTMEIGAGRTLDRVVALKNGKTVTRQVTLEPIETGMSLADAEAIVSTHRTKYEPLAERVWEHQAAMIDLKVRAGLLTAAEGDWIKRTNQKHVPLYRDFHAQTERVGRRSAGGGAIAGGSNGMFRIKGSKRDIVPPLQSIIGDTFANYNMTMRHRAATRLLQEAQHAPDGAKVMTVMKNPPVERVDVSVRQAIKQLRDLGYPITTPSKARRRIRDAKRAGNEVDPADEELVELFKGIADQQIFEFRTITKPSARDRVQLVMPMLIKGKRKFVQVNDVNLYETLTGLNNNGGWIDDLADVAGGFLRANTSLLRQSATLAIGFIKRNPVRDIGTSFRRTNIERLIVPGEQLIRGVGILLNHYANSTGARRVAPPLGKARVFWQIENLLNEGAKATLRSQVGTAAVGAGLGSLQGDSPEGRIGFGLAGAAVALGAKRLGSPTVRGPGGTDVDLFDLWMQNGGGGVTLAGLTIDEHTRALKRLRDEPIAKRVVVNGLVDGLRGLAQISETATRLGELQVVMRQELAKGSSLADAKAAGLFAAAEVTQDFTKGGRLSMAWNQLLPFANANIRGKADFVNDVKDPVRLTRTIAAVTAPSLALMLMQRDDPEYQDAPQYEKDTGWIFIWPPKPVRDLAQMMAEEPDKMEWVPLPLRAWLAEMHEQVPQRIVLPKPFDSGVLFGSIPERAFESILRAADDDPTTDPEQAGALKYELNELVMNLVNPFSAPPTIQAFLDASDGKDFAGRQIVPRGLEFARAEDQATARTGETARLAAKGTRLLSEPFGGDGIPAAQIQQGVSTILGPTFGEIPLGISDAVIRRGRERVGLPPQRVLPEGGFTVPNNFTRTFVKGGEEGGGSAAVTQFQELLPQARQRWSEYINAAEGSPERAALAKDPLVVLYATGVGPSQFGALRRAERSITRLRREKREWLEKGDVERARRIDRQIIDVARDLMQEVGRARSGR